MLSPCLLEFSWWRFCAWIRWSVVVVHLSFPGSFSVLFRAFLVRCVSVVRYSISSSRFRFLFRLQSHFFFKFSRSHLQMRPTPVAARAEVVTPIFHVHDAEDGIFSYYFHQQIIHYELVVWLRYDLSVLYTTPYIIISQTPLLHSKTLKFKLKF